MVVVVTERALAAASLYMDAVVRGTGRKQSTAQQRLAMTRTHARTHIRTHAHTHTYTHMYVHVHTLSLTPLSHAPPLSLSQHQILLTLSKSFR